MTQTRTAFIAIVGCPNVGKSSILNRLLGQKVAVVSPKPQTTRTKIMGVLTEDEVQLVFTDTPGFHRPRTKLGEATASRALTHVYLLLSPRASCATRKKTFSRSSRTRKCPSFSP